jgi:glycosyltransferase involved in cell wall biosynthesis
MSNASPKVSVGMPVYNGGRFLRRSVESLLQQNYDDFELIISDNASTDQTESICRELAAGDHRIRYHRNPENVGAARNYNKVFHLARGRYFKWAAHDDECHPSFLRRCVETLEQGPRSAVMVYPLAELIDEQGKVLEPVLDRISSSDPRPYRRVAHLLWSLNMCDPVFGLYKVEYLKKTQLIGPFCGADYVMLGELAMMGEILELDEVLFRLRAHARRSMQANRSVRARTAWYDPAAASRLFVLPDWEQMVLQLMRSVRRADLSPVDRLKCWAAIPSVHYWRRFKAAGGLLKRRLKAAVRPGNAAETRKAA